ncbi:hypothetical protein FKM82_016422 [Ascaphus truei]
MRYLDIEGLRIRSEIEEVTGVTLCRSAIKGCVPVAALTDGLCLQAGRLLHQLVPVPTRTCRVPAREH